MNFFVNILMVTALSFGIMPISSASAQGSYDKHKEEIELTASIINLERKEILDRNLKLSDGEAEKFWSLYNEYRLSMNEITKRKTKLITDYADSIKNESLSNDKALSLLKEFFSVEQEKLARREEYVSKFQEVLPPKKVVLFFQIENKIDAALNFDLAKVIPLVK